MNPAGVDVGLLERMTDGLKHRGPDAGGVWISADRRVGFGHRRLSIIDLDPRSNQPFLSDDGQRVLVFNGEIYNFADIRRELEAAGHRFRTSSDTEVLLHAYEEWDTECVHKLRGMFAFALYDVSRQRLWIARDRLGIKPVIYYEKDGLFAFASDLQVLTREASFDSELDISALYDCLTYLYIPAPKTAFRYLRKLEAGHALLVESGRVRTYRYWDVPAFGENVVDEATAIRRLRERIDESVRLRLIADVPVGTLLSGGVDSSTVTYYAQKNASGPLCTFSIGFDVAANNELDYANHLAQRVGSRHVTHTYQLSEAIADAAHCMYLYGEPHGDSSIFPTTLVSRIARQQVTVALSGDGGDEVFWGYRRYLTYPRLNGKTLPASGALRALLTQIAPFGMRGRHRLLYRCVNDFDLYTILLGGFLKEEKARFIHPDVIHSLRDYDDYWAFRKYWKESLPLAARLQYLDLKTYLPDDILVKVDRASMAVALEARVPLLDHKLVEEVFSWPSEIRSDGRTLKYVFKKAMRGLLPDAILDKPKHGFSMPWRTWLRGWGDFRKLCGDGKFFARNTPLPPTYTPLMIQAWLNRRAES